MNKIATCPWKAVSLHQYHHYHRHCHHCHNRHRDYHDVSVSHTTDDLVFEWFPVEDQPLVVEPLQLPQVRSDDRVDLDDDFVDDCNDFVIY